MTSKVPHLADLQAAVDLLINPTRMKIRRENGATEWQTIPSLWTQLEQAVSWSGGSGGSGGAYASRPTIATGAVALIIEISQAARERAEELREQADEPKRSYTTPPPATPDQLRKIAAHDMDLDMLDWWVTNVRRWASEARALLALDPPHPKWARDTPCPECKAHNAVTDQDGDTIKTPALALTWVGPDASDQEYHQDHEWLIRAIECKACGQVWWRSEVADLGDLIETMRVANLTRETMTD